jgi:uncharacterized protein YutE (UPF0331/DUF86 family)
MNSALINLAQHIREEMPEIERVIQRAQAAWQRLKLTTDDMYLDSAALNLHGFYEGLERLFDLIALTVDKERPQGAEWHRELLAQMQREMPDIRPAVISEDSRRELDDYRGFRHIVRHVYTFSFDPHRVGELITKITPVFSRVQQELLAFANFLEHHAREESK